MSPLKRDECPGPEAMAGFCTQWLTDLTAGFPCCSVNSEGTTVAVGVG